MKLIYIGKIIDSHIYLGTINFKVALFYDHSHRDTLDNMKVIDYLFVDNKASHFNNMGNRFFKG